MSHRVKKQAEKEPFGIKLNTLHLLIIAGAIILYSRCDEISLHHFQFDFKVTETIGFSVSFVNNRAEEYRK